LPALVTIVVAIIAVVLALGSLNSTFGSGSTNLILPLGIVAYLLGAVGASILWNWQRAADNRSRQKSECISLKLGLTAEMAARIFMIIGLLAAVAAAIAVATELARMQRQCPKPLPASPPS
jgi:NhaP-type Na+/H+ or K+/H+ antiporter